MSGYPVVADRDQGASVAIGPVHDDAAIDKLRRDVIADMPGWDKIRYAPQVKIMGDDHAHLIGRRQPQRETGA